MQVVLPVVKSLNMKKLVEGEACSVDCLQHMMVKFVVTRIFCLAEGL